MTMDYEQITEKVNKRLSEERFQHSKRAAEIASLLAARIGYDVQKARTAAILHDIARELPKEELLTIAEKYGVKLSEFNMRYMPSIHGKVGAAIAKYEFCIEDKEILLSISNHVTGRPCMTIPELLLYAADHLARLEKENPDQFESFCAMSPVEMVYELMGMVIAFDAEHGRTIDERTSQTFDWLIEELHGSEEDNEIILQDDALHEYDVHIDGMIDFYRKHRLAIRSVSNIRQAGGYPCMDGRIVNDGMIVRSGELSRISEEDAQILKKTGVNYIIDLRSEYEIGLKPDKEIEGVKYVNIPLCRNSGPHYSDRLLDWYKECDDKAEASWLTEHYFDSMDMDKMYEHILNDADTIDKLHDIIKVMLKDDCTGVLVHCTSGKDRTGIVTAFILELLGVDEPTIENDYFASQVPYYAKTADLICDAIYDNYSPQTCLKVISVMSVDRDRIEKCKKVLGNVNCNSDRLDIGLFGITKEDVDRLKRKFSHPQI